MTTKEHTNLLSIFSFIFAGIQGFMFLFIALYLVLMLVMMIMGIVNGGNGNASGIIVFAVIILLFAILAAMGIATITMNIKTGKRLRSERPPTKRSLIVTSILNICSFLCGGIFVLPFGTALGIYGLWFATSDVGKRYFASIADDLRLMTPPIPQAYPTSDQTVPYRWQ